MDEYITKNKDKIDNKINEINSETPTNEKGKNPVIDLHTYIC